MSKRRKERDCRECMAYYNMLGDEDYRCGLGFRVAEDIEGGYGPWTVRVHPVENECESIEIPETKEGFVETAASLGIEWDIDDVLIIEEAVSGEW